MLSEERIRPLRIPSIYNWGYQEEKVKVVRRVSLKQRRVPEKIISWI